MKHYVHIFGNKWTIKAYFEAIEAWNRRIRKEGKHETL